MNANLNPQDDDRLSAYLDGELTTEQRRELEELLDQRPDYRDVLGQMERLRADFNSLPRQQLERSLRGVVATQLEPANVLAAPARSAASHRSGPAWKWKWYGAVATAGALAASLLLIGILSRPKDRPLAQAPEAARETILGRAGQGGDPQLGTKADAGPLEGVRPFSEAAPSMALRHDDDSQQAPGEARDRSLATTPQPAAPLIRDDVRLGVPLEEVETPPDAAGRPPMVAARSQPESGGAAEAVANPFVGRSIVIQPTTSQGHQQLIATIAQLPIQLDDETSEPGYSEPKADVARRQFTHGPLLSANPDETVTIDLTGTPADIAWIVRLARQQDARVSMTGGLLAGEQGDAFRFSGTIRAWSRSTDPPGSASQQPVETESAEEGDAEAREPAAPSDGAASTLSVPSPPGDSQPALMRWQITILPIDAQAPPAPLIPE